MVNAMHATIGAIPISQRLEDILLPYRLASAWLSQGLIGRPSYQQTALRMICFAGDL